MPAEVFRWRSDGLCRDQRFSHIIRAPRSMEFRPQYVHANAGQIDHFGSGHARKYNRAIHAQRFSTFELVEAKFATEIIFRRTGGTTSPRSIRANLAPRLDRNRDHVWNGHHCRFVNAPGSSSTSASIRGGRTGIPMITTDTVLRRSVRIRLGVITTRGAYGYAYSDQNGYADRSPTRSSPLRRSVCA